MSTANVHHFPSGLMMLYRDAGVPHLAAHRANRLHPVELKSPPIESKTVPVTQPVILKAYGNDKTPAPKIVLHIEQ